MPQRNACCTYTAGIRDISHIVPHREQVYEKIIKTLY